MMRCNECDHNVYLCKCPSSIRFAKLTAGATIARDEMPPIAPFASTRHDAVHHPSHYTAGSTECIDAIEAALTPEEASGYRKGNAMKYLWRAGKKDDPETDIAKAQWYLNREMEA